MNSLRKKMIDEMTLAALAPRSCETYLNAIDRLAAKTWCAIEDLSEEEVRAYILELRENGAAKGTFKTNWFGIRFLFERTLGRKWDLFGKKKSDNQSKNVFQML